MNKLIILGDSIAKGVMYSEEKRRYTTYTHAYEQKLALAGIRTENYSKMGATSDKIEQILDRRIDEMNSDSAVLLSFGGNDSDYDWDEVCADPYAEHSPKTPRHELLKTYVRIIERIKNTGAYVVVSNLAPINAEKYMNWISRGRDREKLLTFLGDVTTLYRWQEYYNYIVECAAVRTDSPLLDVRGDFLLSLKYDGLIGFDGLHPTQTGHEIIDRAVYSFVKKYDPPICI